MSIAASKSNLRGHNRHSYGNFIRRYLVQNPHIAQTFFTAFTGILSTLGLLFYFLTAPSDKWNHVIVITVTGISVVAFIILFAQWLFYFYIPAQRLKKWTQKISTADNITEIPNGIPKELRIFAEHINNLSRTTHILYSDMDEMVCNETRHLAQKTRSLEILYELAATIAAAPTIETLFNRILPLIANMSKANAATIRLRTQDNLFKLVEHYGLASELRISEDAKPIEDCLLNNELPTQGILTIKHIQNNPDCDLQSSFETPTDLISVPIPYGDSTLGLINLYVPSEHSLKEDEQDTLVSVGRHLGIALIKSNLDNQSKRLSIIQERNLLAHELHDSLAQTLASMRFHVKLLEEMLLEKSIPFHDVDDEVQGIKGTLEEANTELRELLAHFRAPVDERGLIPALKAIIDRFQKQTGIDIFLQQNWDHTSIPATYELQILRIIQESLSNIRKHAKAENVRVLLKKNDHYQVLIEDDGIGFDQQDETKEPGKHIGLSIMKERARHVNGELTIESEKGEGTRVLLTFEYNPKVDS